MLGHREIGALSLSPMETAIVDSAIQNGVAARGREIRPKQKEQQKECNGCICSSIDVLG
jgi:hypothetical protein